jgi:hypothetical protein
MALARSERSVRKPRDRNPLREIGRALSDHGRALGEMRKDVTQLGYLTTALCDHARGIVDERLFPGKSDTILRVRGPQPVGNSATDGKCETHPYPPRNLVGAAAGPTTARATTEVEQALNQLDGDLSELFDAIESIDSRLAPVSVDAPPAPGGSEPASRPTHGSSSLVRMIDNHASRVSQMAQRLKIIKARLEV